MATTEDYRLGREQELRIEVDFGARVKLRLMEGQAELFGTVLAPRIEYSLSGCKAAVFTWQGCTLQIIGKPQHAYVAEETPMMTYLNVHLALEKLRRQALQSGLRGPRVMVVGPTDVGKSTLCRILLNYCVRIHQRSLFVDLDVGQGAVTLPGSICAVSLERAVDIESGFEGTTPLVYYYGYTSPGENPKSYNALVSRLANLVEQRLASDREMDSIGIIVNTCGWVENVGYQTMMYAMKALQVNVIVVLGDERLYSEIARETQGDTNLNLIKLPKSGGVVVRDPRYRKRSRNQKIREYFYGCKEDLAPHRISLSFADFELYRVGQEFVAPTSALPVGEERKVDETSVVRVNPSPDILYSILGLSYADEAISKSLLEANVAGFVYVDEIDMVNKRLNVLAPAPGKLPKRLLVMGSLKWLE